MKVRCLGNTQVEEWCPGACLGDGVVDTRDGGRRVALETEDGDSFWPDLGTCLRVRWVEVWARSLTVMA